MRQQIFEEGIEKALDLLQAELQKGDNPRRTVAKVFAVLDNAAREPRNHMRALVRDAINNQPNGEKK